MVLTKKKALRIDIKGILYNFEIGRDILTNNVVEYGHCI